MSSQSEKPPGDNLPIKQDNIEATSCQTMDGTTHLNNPGPSGSRRRSNPYCFPENVLCQDVTYNGVAVTQFTAAMDSIAQLKIIRSLLMRSDDVIIAAFPKCGKFGHPCLTQSTHRVLPEHSIKSQRASC